MDDPAVQDFELDELVHALFVEERLQIVQGAHDVRGVRPGFRIAVEARVARGGEGEFADVQGVVAPIDGYSDVAEEEKIAKTLSLCF